MSKKMCPQKTTNSKKYVEQLISPTASTAGNLCEIAAFEPPVYKTNNAGSYVEFRAFDPESRKMRRKTIKLNHINGIGARKQYAKDLIKRLNAQLLKGWNPWICKDSANLKTFEEAVGRYESYLERMNESGLYRKETYAGYKSFTKILKEYVRLTPIYYIYQFDRQYCTNFLDYIFIERNNCAQTRNNYLTFLRIFSGFLVEKGYLKERPTDGIKPINKRLIKKSRTDIPVATVAEIGVWCREHDPHFHLACLLLYYCFIRPVEMTRLRISDFNIRQSTIVMRPEISKNKELQTVSVPSKVLKYAIELGIFEAPMQDFLFSVKGLRPGREPIDPKIFRDHWAKVRRALNLRPEWKFYSLKDTGITELLDSGVVPIAVRDQARHSSLEITEVYTRHSAEANQDLVRHEGSL